MELRLAAHLSGDENIIGILQSAAADGDVFRMLASHWMDKGVDEVTDEERQTVKRISCKETRELLQYASAEATKF
jgi:DNA polymerase I-like protein with 3'-5' exonuclease and polymerase domains